jgi:hypothetical protein
MTEVTVLVLLGAGGVVGLLLRSFLPSYLTQKGQNLATKEDVAAITREVEAAKLEYVAQAERLRSDLNAALHERQVRYAKLHERRIEAIDGLYVRLVRAQQDFAPLAGGFVTQENVPFQKKLDTAAAAGRELLDFFANHRLYYPKPLIEAFGNLERVLSGAWSTFAWERRGDDWVELPREERERQVSVWKEAREAIHHRVPELLQKVEETMRQILGDANEAESESTAVPGSRLTIGPPPARPAAAPE